MFPTRIIVEDSLRANDDGFAFDIRLNWYRALPLSCFDTLEVRLDERSFDRRAITVTLNGQTRALDELAGLTDEFWYVTDPAVINVRSEAAPGDGGHDLDVTLGMRIPYLVHDGHAIVVREQCVKTMAVVA